MVPVEIDADDVRMLIERGYLDLDRLGDKIKLTRAGTAEAVELLVAGL